MLSMLIEGNVTCILWLKAMTRWHCDRHWHLEKAMTGIDFSMFGEEYAIFPIFYSRYCFGGGLCMEIASGLRYY